ncbi:FAD:protein FMN transferase [Noviherbaspirillum saxi]|nr:FAD:protein FMN transferase [Noviherbaspirillum saxi]
MSTGVGALALGAGALSMWEAAAFVHATRTDSLQTGKRLFNGADLAFGTTVSVQLLHHNEAVARKAIREALDTAQAIDRLLSVYREGSQVFELNRTGRLRDPDLHLLKVLDAACRLSRQTAGAFDITVQPLWLAAANGKDPRDARRLVGWRKLHISPELVQLKQPGMAITLNGIAQGYASDLALAAVRAHGINDVLVDIGEFSASGQRAPQRLWQVGIQDPRDPQSLVGTVSLQARSLASSGDYETAFSEDFSSHHIVDPNTGHSPLELASVAVAAPTAMLADGLSTAFMVMGTQPGLQLANQLPEIDALFIDKSGRQAQTAGFPWIA